MHKREMESERGKLTNSQELETILNSDEGYMID